MRTRKLRQYAHEFSTGCFPHAIFGVAAAAIFGLEAHRIGLPRLVVFAVVAAVMFAVSVLLAPKRMSDLYTPNARCVIFFAPDEAMRHGSSLIDSEHLLLGVLRENETLPNRLGGSRIAISEFLRRIEGIPTMGQPLAGTVEIPLSPESKQVLRFAAEEAESLRHRNICIGHLLLGILRVEQSTAARILQSGGATISGLRERAARNMLWAEATD